MPDVIPNNTNVAGYAYKYISRDISGKIVSGTQGDRNKTIEISLSEGNVILSLLPDTHSLITVQEDEHKYKTERYLDFMYSHVLNLKLKNGKFVFLRFSGTADVVQCRYGRKYVVPENVRGKILEILESWHSKYNGVKVHAANPAASPSSIVLWYTRACPTSKICLLLQTDVDLCARRRQLDLNGLGNATVCDGDFVVTEKSTRPD